MTIPPFSIKKMGKRHSECGFSVFTGLFLVYALFNLAAVAFLVISLARETWSELLTWYLVVRLVLAIVWAVWFAFSSCRDRTLDGRPDCVDLPVLVFVFSSVVFFVVIAAIDADRHTNPESIICACVDGAYVLIFLVAELAYAFGWAHYPHDPVHHDGHDDGTARGTLVGRTYGYKFIVAAFDVNSLVPIATQAIPLLTGLIQSGGGCCGGAKTTTDPIAPGTAPKIPTGGLIPGAGGLVVDQIVNVVTPLAPVPGPFPVPIPPVPPKVAHTSRRSGLVSEI